MRRWRWRGVEGPHLGEEKSTDADLSTWTNDDYPRLARLMNQDGGGRPRHLGGRGDGSTECAVAEGLAAVAKIR